MNLDIRICQILITVVDPEGWRLDYFNLTNAWHMGWQTGLLNIMVLEFKLRNAGFWYFIFLV